MSTEAVVILVLGIFTAVCGTVELFGNRWRSLVGWALVAAGVALAIIAIP